MCFFEPGFRRYWLLVLPLTGSLEWRAPLCSSANRASDISSAWQQNQSHFKGFLCIFLWFCGGFTAGLLKKENIHLHAAKHRQGANSVLLQYLISVRQTSFWKELMFLSIQFWFTVQPFLHSNTLGKIVNRIFLFSFYLYSWIKLRNYWFMLQSFFSLAVNLLQYFMILVCCISSILLLISGWNCELFAWRTLRLHGMNRTIGGTC